MRIVADLMTRDVITLFEDNSLTDARAIMKQRGIRHIPVINRSGELVGVLTQRAMLTVALNIADQIGLKRLERVESEKLVKEIMEPSGRCFTENDSLLEAADHLLTHKNAILCVTRDKEIVGIVSPVDFLRCAVFYLKHQA
jgi:CBS domain-containing protein